MRRGRPCCVAAYGERRMMLFIGRFSRLTAIGALVATTLALIATPLSSAWSQGTGQQQKLRVATRVLPPLVVEQPGGKLSGFSIELWDKIAEKLKLQTTYQIAPDVRSLLDD